MSTNFVREGSLAKLVKGQVIFEFFARTTHNLETQTERCCIFFGITQLNQFCQRVISDRDDGFVEYGSFGGSKWADGGHEHDAICHRGRSLDRRLAFLGKTHTDIGQRGPPPSHSMR